MTMQERINETMKQISELLPNRKPGQSIRMLRPSPRVEGRMQSFDGLLDADGNVYGFGNKKVGTLETCKLDVEYIEKRNTADAKDAKSRKRFNKAQERFERNATLHENEDKNGVAY